MWIVQPYWRFDADDVIFLAEDVASYSGYYYFVLVKNGQPKKVTYYRPFCEPFRVVDLCDRRMTIRRVAAHNLGVLLQSGLLWSPRSMQLPGSQVHAKFTYIFRKTQGAVLIMTHNSGITPTGVVTDFAESN